MKLSEAPRKCELSHVLRKYADDLDAGRPLAASMLCVVAADGKGNAAAAVFGSLPSNTPPRDVGIALCTAGIDRFLSAPLKTTRSSTR